MCIFPIGSTGDDTLEMLTRAYTIGQDQKLLWHGDQAVAGVELFQRCGDGFLGRRRVSRVPGNSDAIGSELRAGASDGVGVAPDDNNARPFADASPRAR